jgi:hypothetical protein
MANGIDRNALMKNWIHSHEEDTDDVSVFRPSSFNFPRSRGRRSLELSPDGKVIEHGIGPNDRPTVRSGSWKLNDPDQLQLSCADGVITLMRVLQVDDNRLVVKKS